MPRWDDLDVFLAAFRAGSIVQAAARLGVGVTTVSRRLDRLEEHVGQPLFARTSTGLDPLPAALALRPHAEAAEQALLAGQAAIAAQEPSAHGRVTIALPTDMVLLVLLPHLAQFTRAHPQIELVFDQGNSVADLMRREADIAVRVVRPQAGDELISTRLRPVELAVFGSRTYLRDHPSPHGDAHIWVGWTEALEHLPESRWLQQVSPNARYALRTSHTTTVRLAAAAGLGLAVMPRLFGQLSPTLQEVTLEGPPPPTYDLWLITHRALRHSARVDAVWTYLDQRLRAADQDDLAMLSAELHDAYGLTFDSVTNHSSS